MMNGRTRDGRRPVHGRRFQTQSGHGLVGVYANEALARDTFRASIGLIVASGTAVAWILITRPRSAAFLAERRIPKLGRSQRPLASSQSPILPDQFTGLRASTVACPVVNVGLRGGCVKKLGDLEGWENA